MTLTYTLRIPCILCGYRLHGVMSARVRVNKRSIRPLPGGGFVLMARSCPECGSRNAADAVRATWQLEPASVAAIQEYRERRWAA